MTEQEKRYMKAMVAYKAAYQMLRDGRPTRAAQLFEIGAQAEMAISQHQMPDFEALAALLGKGEAR